MLPHRLVAQVLARCSVATLALLIALSMRGDSGSRVLDLCRSAPLLEPVHARHLVLDDDRAFRRYSEGIGLIALRGCYGSINTTIWAAPPDSYLTVFRELSPYLERICAASHAVFGATTFCDLEYRRAMGGRMVTLVRNVRELNRLASDDAIPIAERMAGYRRLIVEFQQVGYVFGVLRAEGALSAVMGMAGNREQRMLLLRTALRRARDLRADEMVCQFLGELGGEQSIAGHVDSMLTCFSEGVAIADNQQFYDQAVRFRLLLASHYADEGRYAVAADLMREAHRVGRQWGVGLEPVRLVLQAMTFFSDLGCWDIVRSYSQRLPVLLRAYEQAGMHHDFQVYSVRARYWEGCLLAAQGKPAEGATVLAALQGPMRRLHPGSYAALQVNRAEALIAAGRPREALAVVADGVAFADSHVTVGLGTRLRLARVRAALASGDLDLASTALGEARSHRGLDDRNGVLDGCECDALDAEIALGRGGPQSSWQKLGRGLSDLSTAVRGIDAGPHSFMALAQVEGLREVGHRLLANDAAGSYRFELQWRSLPGLLGRRDPAALLGPPSILESGGTPTIHLVYGFTSAGLTRWTRVSGSVRREVLAASRDECDRQVERAMRLLSRDPGSPDAPMTDSLRVVCGELGRLLLPPEVREGPPVRLVISAEGSIARLPFEALDVGAKDYEPLLARHEVVYARPVPPIRRRPRDGSVILVGGEESPGELTTGLSRVSTEEEVRQVSARLPHARILHSNQISKQALLESWSRASILYVAAHLVRDPEAPLLCYFPMTFGARPNRVEDTYLDLGDVSNVDLSGCDLAVLSSCASGEPYVVGGRAGPSMADAMLDAGAHAVIHTRWRVRDDRAAVIAPRLADAWIGPRHDRVSEWCATRRAALRGPQGWRHPFEWAAWSVTVGLPVQPWRAVHGGVMAAHARPAPPVHAPRVPSAALSRSPP
jgi:hypothetical protein